MGVDATVPWEEVPTFSEDLVLSSWEGVDLKRLLASATGRFLLEDLKRCRSGGEEVAPEEPYRYVLTVEVETRADELLLRHVTVEPTAYSLPSMETCIQSVYSNETLPLDFDPERFPDYRPGRRWRISMPGILAHR